jgi:pimeloyl-ACP methyl ester carboxylesterase
MSSPLLFSSKKIEEKCNTSYFFSKYSAKIGYVVTKNIVNTNTKNCIIILPGLTGYAIPFIEWFFELYNENTALVSLDYRGFGLSEYKTNMLDYKGINIDTITFDINKLYNLLNIKTKNIFILGHSYGVLVGYNLINKYNYNIKNILGFIQIDESLMNVPQLNATDITYPNFATFSWQIVEKWVKDYQTFNVNQGYYLVNSSLLEQFKIPGFAMNNFQLNEWMKYTSNINGNILSFLYKEAMMIDYAFLVDEIFIKFNLPLFIYAGIGSIVPYQTQLWIYNKIKNNKYSKLLLLTEKEGGYHTPFIPTSICRKKLFLNINNFINDINI